MDREVIREVALSTTGIRETMPNTGIQGQEAPIVGRIEERAIRLRSTVGEVVAEDITSTRNAISSRR